MNKKSNGTKQSLGGLKEVREIIFGEALNGLQSQIDDLKTENKKLKDELKIHENNFSKSNTIIENLSSIHKDSNSEQKKMNDLITTLKTDFEKQIKDLQTSKIGKNQIGQAFIEWGMKVKQDDN